VDGLDGCAYVAGVICPECLTDAEHQKVEGGVLELQVYGDTTDMRDYGVVAAIFIDRGDDPGVIL
jgi:hypothetical protein